MPIPSSKREKYIFRASEGSWYANFAPTFAKTVLVITMPKKAGRYIKPTLYFGNPSIFSP